MSEHYLYQELRTLLQTDSDLFDWFEQGATDGMWYWDLQKPEHEWLSPAFKHCFGFADDEMPHTPDWWQNNIFPEDLEQALANLEQHKQNPDHPYDQIVRYRHRDGHTVWIRCRGRIIRDENGKAIRMLGAHTDVTPLFETRNQLEKTTASLQTSLQELSEINRIALTTSQIGIWFWDVQEDTLIWDASMFYLYGIEPQEKPLSFEQWASMLHPDDADEKIAEVRRSMLGDSELRSSLRVILPDGNVRYLKASANIFYDSQGNVTHMRGANWDVTEERLREIELQRSNRDLTTFAYVASHDLKAPLRGIRQLASWIEEDIDLPSNEVRENLQLMKSRISRVEALLDDLLSYSRIGREEDTYQETTCCDKLVREIYDYLTPPEEFSLIIESSLPEIVTQKALLEQVLNNLIGNAIKYRQCDSGSVFVGAKRYQQGFYFYVADNGNAIDYCYHKRIFEMFQTLQPRDSVEGSGMGLAISKRIVENRGGRLFLRNPESSKANSRYSNEFIFSWPDIIQHDIRPDE